MGIRKTTTVDVSRACNDIKTGVAEESRDESGGCPCIGQAVSGMEVA
jgi:hypothetical protein